jgi:hypothetical protein
MLPEQVWQLESQLKHSAPITTVKSFRQVVMHLPWYSSIPAPQLTQLVVEFLQVAQFESHA